MFERNKVDNGSRKSSVTAEVTLDDRSIMKRKFLIRSFGSLEDALNYGGQFLEFEDFTGTRSLLAKSRFKAVKVVEAPNKLHLEITDDGFDPHQVLEIRLQAAPAEIRQAYLPKSKSYHQDRFADIDLPPEVASYMTTMAWRINLAYQMLHTQPLSASLKPFDPQPVYTISDHRSPRPSAVK